MKIKIIAGHLSERTRSVSRSLALSPPVGRRSPRRAEGVTSIPGDGVPRQYSPRRGSPRLPFLRPRARTFPLLSGRTEFRASVVLSENVARELRAGGGFRTTTTLTTITLTTTTTTGENTRTTCSQPSNREVDGPFLRASPPQAGGRIGTYTYLGVPDPRVPVEPAQPCLVLHPAPAAPPPALAAQLQLGHLSLAAR
eukprot:1190882-Prorocentrum_minimum.AAC.4